MGGLSNMDFVYFLLLILITGFFYMIVPVVFVKIYGKVSSGKAFLISLLNWIILYVIYRIIYNLIFPGDINALNSSGPALWLYIAWKYMTIKNANKKTISHNSTPNSIDDLEIKFGVDFKNTYRETFTRKDIKFALFIFRIDQNNMQYGQPTSVLVVNTQTTDYRYFVVEKSLGNSFMLCEWIFDKGNKKIKHLNYGGVAQSIFDSSTEKVIVGNEVLIEQVHTIIAMKVEPEVTSTISKTGWSSTTKKVDEAFEEKIKKIVDNLKSKSS